MFYPFDLTFRRPFGQAIGDEYASVDFHMIRGKVVLVLLVVLACSVLIRMHRLHLSDLVLMLLGFCLGLTYQRLLFFAGIVAAPVAAELLQGVRRYRPEIDKPWLNAAILWGISAFVVYRFPTPAQLEEMVAEQYPADVLTYLKSHAPSGHGLNFYSWGGYLGWEDPQFKVFVDTREDLFEYAGVLKDYLDFAEFNDPYHVLDKYQIRYVLFPPRAPINYLLKGNPNWKLVFSGRTSTLFERAP